jgi:NAD+ synthase (glutamine-hydrolysing)
MVPSKIAFLALHAWGDAAMANGRPASPERRGAYDLATIRHWLEVFLRRFRVQPVQTVGDAERPESEAGGSLSPRDWRALPMATPMPGSPNWSAMCRRADR